jgi:uncharacterized protein YndB with AHSA1/START domain
MERKTKVTAEEGKHDLVITREFDLPVELLFQAHTEAEIVEQWMGTKVIKLEPRQHGGWHYETTDPQGNKHVFNGVFHSFVPDERFTRTFEMENTPFPVQLEFFEFEKLSDDRSKLTMHIIYRSGAYRDQMLKMPFEFGINMAHNRLQEVAIKLK